METAHESNRLHDFSNDNRQRLISFAFSKNLKIMSTNFPCNNIYKATWKSLNRMTKNQIDHVLLESRHRSSITDVRSRRGAECGTDHYLTNLKLTFGGETNCWKKLDLFGLWGTTFPLI